MPVLLPLPAGTQVVTRVDWRDENGAIGALAGTVGVILQAEDGPDGRCRVRLLNGIEVALPRKHLTVRKLASAYDLDTAGKEIQAGMDLFPFVIYRCIVGSHAYGLAHEHSDVDRRGFYLAPAGLHWSLFGVPEQLEIAETDECYWELQKFIQMALRGNPNVLECLYTPLVETVSPLAQELLDQRELFLTRMVFQTYNGYVISQFKKLEQDLRVHGEIRWKHAMHLIRLLISGTTVLREGYVPLAVDRHRAQLLAIRHGEQTWAAVDAWRQELQKDFEAAYLGTRLPVQPDFRWANDFLVRARRSMVED